MQSNWSPQWTSLDEVVAARAQKDGTALEQGCPFAISRDPTRQSQKEIKPERSTRVKSSKENRGQGNVYNNEPAKLHARSDRVEKATSKEKPATISECLAYAQAGAGASRKPKKEATRPQRPKQQDHHVVKPLHKDLATAFGPTPQDMVRRAEAKILEAQRDAEGARRKAEEAREEMLSLRADLDMSRHHGHFGTHEAYLEAEEAKLSAAVAKVHRLVEDTANISTAEAELVDLRNHVDCLQEERRGAEAATARLHEEVERLQTENFEVKSSADTEIDRLEYALEQQQILFGEKSAECEAASARESEAREELDQLLLSMSRKPEAEVDVDATVDVGYADEPDVKEEIQRLKAVCAADAQRADSAEAELQRLQEESGAADGVEAETLREELSAVRATLAAKESSDAAEVEEARSEVGQLRMEAERLREACATADSEQDQEASAELASARALQAKAEADADFARESMEALSSELENQKAEAAAASAAEERAAEEAETAAAAASTEHERLVAELSEEAKRTVAAEAKLEQVREDSDRMHAACTAAAASEGGASANATAAMAAASAAQAEAASLKGEVGRLQQRVEDSNSKAEAQSQTANEKMSALRSSLTAKEASLGQLRQEAEAAAESSLAEVDLLKAQRDEEAQRAAAAANAARDATKDVEKFRRVAADKESLLAKQSQQADEASASLRSVSAELEQLREAEAQRRSAAESSEGQLHEENKRLKAALSEKQARVEELAHQAESSSSSRQETEKVSSSMRSEITTLLASKEALNSELKELRPLHSKVTELQWEISGLASSKDALNVELEELKPLREKVVGLQRTATKSAHAVVKQEADAVECDQMRGQVRELVTTMQNFKQQNESLVVENRRLNESLGIFENDLDNVSTRHATLIGHVNSKQKLRYTLKLKDEKNELRAENDKMRGRLAKLEGRGKGETLFEALVSLGYGPSGMVEQGARSPAPPPSHLRSTAASSAAANQGLRTPSKNSPSVPPRTPQRTPMGAVVPPLPKMGHAGSHSNAEDQLQETAHRCRVQERALERINTDFQHLVSLIERAALGDESRKGSGTGALDFAGLLHRLRGMNGMSLPATKEPRACSVEPAALSKRFEADEASSAAQEPHQYLRAHTGDGGAAVPGVHVYYGEGEEHTGEHVGAGGYHGEETTHDIAGLQAAAAHEETHDIATLQVEGATQDIASYLEASAPEDDM